MFALGISCRLLGAALYIRARCPGCATYLRLFRLPCGCSTCGCICDSLRCPNCAKHYPALSDIQTLSSDEDPRTILAASSEACSRSDGASSRRLPLHKQLHDQPHASSAAERLLDFAAIFDSVQEERVPDVARDAIEFLHSLMPVDTTYTSRKSESSSMGDVGLTCEREEPLESTRNNKLFVVQKGRSSRQSKVRVSCFLCGKMFESWDSLSSHESQTHPDAFRCAACPRHFCCSRDLRRHSRSTQHGISISFRLDVEPTLGSSITPHTVLGKSRWHHAETGRVLREVHAREAERYQGSSIAAEVLGRYLDPNDGREYLWCPASNEFFYITDASADGWEMVDVLT